MSESQSAAQKVAGATYTRAGAGYFEKRTLKRSAGVWGQWWR
jgi:ethanolamine permease